MCTLSPLISRSVTGSTVDFGSASFGSIPDGKTRKVKMIVAIFILLLLDTLLLMSAVSHLSVLRELSKVQTEAKLQELKMWHGNAE
jgi:hypothetical protein